MVSTDSGTTWVRRASVPVSARFAISYNGAVIIAATTTLGTGATGLVYKSTDYGITWVDMGLPAGFWNTITINDNATQIVVGANQGTYINTVWIYQ